MQIDLDPDKYAVKTKSGWKRLSNPKRSGWLFGFCVVFLGVVWWNGGVDSTSALGAMIAFCGGVLAADWLRDLY